MTYVLSAYQSGSFVANTALVHGDLNQLKADMLAASGANAVAAYLPLAGGTMTGNLVVANTIVSVTQNLVDNTSNVATTAFVQNVVSTTVNALDFLPLYGGSLTGWLTAQEIFANPGYTGGVAFIAQGNCAVAFDASGGTWADGALRLAQGQYIALEATSTINMGLLSGNTLQVTNGNAVNFALTQAGALTVAASIQAPVISEASGSLGTSTTINMANGAFFSKTINSAPTFSVTNVPASGNVATLILRLTNGGSNTVTWFPNVRWGSGTAPTLTANGVDLVSFVTPDGGSNWYGTSGLNFQ
jgi:hypothetical protein